MNTLKIITFILLGFSFSACQPDRVENSKTHDHEKSKIEIKTPSDDNCLEPNQLLNKIYETQFSITDRSEKQLAEYFTQSLVNLILEEEQCRKKFGICNLEFDIFSDSQDPQFNLFHIAKTQVSHKYIVTLSNQNDKTKILYDMSQATCPKILNIRYSDGTDLVSMLKEKS